MARDDDAHAVIFDHDGTGWRVPMEHGKRALSMLNGAPHPAEALLERMWFVSPDIYGGTVGLRCDTIAAVLLRSADAIEAMREDEQERRALQAISSNFD